jgi:hypothetical protein
MSLLNEYQVVEKEFRKKVRERGERQFRIGVLPWGGGRFFPLCEGKQELIS